MAKLFTDLFYTAQDLNGVPLSGAKLEFFVTGTSTPLATYTDNALSVAHANPVVADSSGRFAPIYLQALDYKAVLSTSADVVIDTIDPVHGAEAASPADLSTTNVFTKTTTWKHGSDVASANALTLGDGNTFDITGTTAITSIGTKGIGTIVVLQFDAILTLTHQASDLVLPGGQNITTAAGDIAIFEEYATGDWRLVNYIFETPGLEPLITAPSTLTNNSGTPLTQLDLAAKTFRAEDSANNIVLPATTIDISTSGDGGGILTGSGARAVDTWYNVISGRRTSDGAFVAGFTTLSVKPTDWDFYRRHGSVLTDGTGSGEIIPFFQNNDDFLWLSPPLDIDLINTLGTTARLDVMSVPVGHRVLGNFNVFTNDIGTPFAVYISSPDVTDLAPSDTVAPLAQSGASNDFDFTQVTVWTDESAQIRSRANISTINGYKVATVGWTDRRGRDG